MEPSRTPVPLTIQPKVSANQRLAKYKRAAQTVAANEATPTTESPHPTTGRHDAVPDARALCMNLTPLPINSQHLAYVCHIQNGPYSFFLQLKSSFEELLPQLIRELEASKVEAPENLLIPGSIVMVIGSGNVLRRAVVKNPMPHTCHVYCIDYGTDKEVPYADIFQLPNSAAALSPAMARQFCLSGVNSFGITTFNMEEFSRLVLGKEVSILVTESTRPGLQSCELFWKGKSMLDIFTVANSQYRFHLAPSCDEAVYVVYSDGPHFFYVHLLSESSILRQIQEEVSSYCFYQPRLEDASHLGIGRPIAVLHPARSEWCRGLVFGILDDGISIFFVDYGFRAVVQCCDLREISTELVTKWHTLAIQCCLRGYESTEPCEKLNTLMKKFVVGRNLKLQLCLITDSFHVCVDLIDDQGNSVTQQMKTNEKQVLAEEKAVTPADETREPPHSKIEERAHQEKIAVTPADETREPPHSKTEEQAHQEKKAVTPADETREPPHSKTEERAHRISGLEEKANGFGGGLSQDRKAATDPRIRLEEKANGFGGELSQDRKAGTDPRIRKENGCVQDLNKLGDVKCNPSVAERRTTVIQEYPHQPILAGQEREVSFASMDSPRNVFVHLAGCDTVLEHIRDMIDAVATAELRPFNIPVLALPVLATFEEDGLLYRALIMSLAKFEKGQVDVLFVDYGNSSVVPVSEVFFIPEDLLKIPIQAIHVIITDMPALPKADVAACESHFLEGALTLRPTSTTTINMVQCVHGTLVLPDGRSVAEAIRNDPLCAGPQISVPAPVPKANAPVPAAEATLPAGTPVERPQKIVSKGVIPKPSPTFEAKIVYDEVPRDTVDVVVPMAVSINDFHVQLVSEMTVIDRLVEHLSKADAFEVIEDPSVGDYLIAKFPDDSAWYRATVISKEPLEVLYVDYGNISPATEFRKMPLDVSNIPVMAWHCSASANDHAVNEKFMNFVNAEAPFEVKFTGIKGGTRHLVELTVDGEDIRSVEPFEANGVKSAVVPTPTFQDPESDEKRLPLPPSLGKSFYSGCSLLHSNSPEDFYVRLGDDSVRAADMSSALSETGNFPKLDLVQKGDFVVAQFRDPDVSYRAVVVNDDPPVVRLTDFGNISPASVFHEMPAKLKQVPQIAVRCSLLTPPGGWSADAVKHFAYLLSPELGLLFDLKILARGDPNIVDVELLGWSLTEELVPATDALPNGIQDDPKTAGSAGQSVRNADQLSKPDDIQLEEFPVTVAFVNSPSDFYIHTDEGQVSRLASILQNTEDFETVNKVEVGHLICAKFAEDECWYRAKVMSVDPVNVFFVDYGNFAEVNEWRKLPEDLSVIPPQALRASLQPQEQDWTAEEIEIFLDVAYSTEMSCKIIEKKPDLTVVRLNTKSGDLITFLRRKP